MWLKIGGMVLKAWSRRWDLNPRPGDYKSPALPLSYGGCKNYHFSTYSFQKSPARAKAEVSGYGAGSAVGTRTAFSRF